MHEHRQAPQSFTVRTPKLDKVKFTVFVSVMDSLVLFPSLQGYPIQLWSFTVINSDEMPPRTDRLYMIFTEPLEQVPSVK